MRDMSETRKRILEYIQKNPGITFRKLAEELNLGIGNLQYHLNVLEKNGLIKSKKVGGKRHIFPAEFEKEYEALLRVISNKTQRKILLLLATGSKTQTEIAKELNLTQATINYHMKILNENNIVERERDGKNVVYTLKYDISTIIRVISEYRPSLWDKLSDNLIALLLEIGGRKND